MTKSYGIILKSYLPNKQKIWVLDRHHGKRACVPNLPAMSPGTLISYYATEGDSVVFIKQIEILDMPFSLAREDILFFHHVLELCYYFIPVGSSVQESFEMLLYLYSHSLKIDSIIKKKIYLLKLFTSFGIFPETMQHTNFYFQRLAHEPIDSLLSQSLDLENEGKIDNWLRMCLSTHPSGDYLKTISFLTNRTT